MTNTFKFRPSIIFRASISDCKKICDELKEDLLQLGLSEEQQELLIQLLDQKKKKLNLVIVGRLFTYSFFNF